MSEILVHTSRFRLGQRNRNIFLSSKVEEVIAASKTVAEFGKSPWGNDFDGGPEGIEGEFKSDLVIPLASASMRDSDTVLLLSDCNLRTDDYSTQHHSLF